MILHICTKEAWEDAMKTGSYKASSLATQGFIHCSKAEQVVDVADYIFKGKEGLILLVIDDEKVNEEIKYEDGGEGEFYPHIYGALNVDAVIKTVPFPPGQDGTFELPDLNK